MYWDYPSYSTIAIIFHFWMNRFLKLMPLTLQCLFRPWLSTSSSLSPIYDSGLGTWSYPLGSHRKYVSEVPDNSCWDDLGLVWQRPYCFFSALIVPLCKPIRILKISWDFQMNTKLPWVLWVPVRTQEELLGDPSRSDTDKLSWERGKRKGIWSSVGPLNSHWLVNSYFTFNIKGMIERM